jgi:hypothetical protein
MVLLVAGAVVLALLLNIAWVAFGPGDGGDRGAIESAVRKTWESKGTAPRSVECTEADASWTCQVESARGDIVNCPLGDASDFLAKPSTVLRSSCRIE